ncbi:MAG: HAMP domain-containing histidine kinase [Solirubrobacterales bacterium]|nr:HAMP domain-containing histidine kinase [Solirubrobacterales bacterium]
MPRPGNHAVASMAALAGATTLVLLTYLMQQAAVSALRDNLPARSANLFLLNVEAAQALDFAGRMATLPGLEGPPLLAPFYSVRVLAVDGRPLPAADARLEEAGLQRETALQAARTFAADAGHELRTPLTSLAANLRAARDDPAALAAGERDAARLGALVEQLQALARGEAGAPARPEPVDLGELGDSAVAALRTRHPEVAVTLEAPGEGPVLQGDAEGLRIMVDNLLENAARHGAGAVRLTVREGELLVDDDGPGIPAAEREAVQRRFVRGSTAQGNGTGLGLAIAGAQAERHGGALALGDSPLGGLRARVTLPS